MQGVIVFMLEDIKFQSYCWSLGTTSFRVKDLNFKIEKQLQILKALVAHYEKLKQCKKCLLSEIFKNICIITDIFLTFKLWKNVSKVCS